MLVEEKIADVLAVEYVPELSAYLVTKSYPCWNMVVWFLLPVSEGVKWVRH